MVHRQRKQDLWIWWCAASAMRKLLHQVWDLESIQGTTQKRVGQAPGNCMFGDSKSEVENSQVSRQEKVLQAARKLGQKDQTQMKSEENPPGTRKLAACSPEFRTVEYTNNRYMDEIFQILGKKLRMSAINATEPMYWHGIVFSIVDESRHPPWAGFLDEFGNLQEHKIREYLECIQHNSKVDKGHGRDRYWPMIKRSSGRRQKYVSTMIPIFASDRWKIFQEQQKDGKAKLKISRGVRRTKMQWDSTKNRLNSSGKNVTGFSSLPRLREIQQDLEKKNIQREDFKDRFIFMSMFNDIEWKKNDEKCVSNAEEVRNYAMKFLRGHWMFLGPESGEKWYGDSHDQKRTWNFTVNKMVQRFEETGHPVFKSTSVLSRGILKQKKGRCTIHFSGDSMNTELLFQTVHSVSQFSLYSAVANWCYQFAFTEGEKGRVGSLVDNKILTMVEPEEVEPSVSPPIQAPGKRMQGGALSFQTLEKKIQLAQLCEKPSSNILWSLGRRTKFDQMGTTDGEQLLLCVENSQVLDLVQKPKLWQLFLKAPLLDQSWKFTLSKKIDRYCTEVAIQSIANPEYTTYVVNSREDKRFLTEIHDHKQELRSSNELFANLHESERNAEGKETRRYKETWQLQARRKLV